MNAVEPMFRHPTIKDIKRTAREALVAITSFPSDIEERGLEMLSLFWFYLALKVC